MNCHRSNCCFFFVSGVLERDCHRAGKEENVKVRRSKLQINTFILLLQMIVQKNFSVIFSFRHFFNLSCESSDEKFNLTETRGLVELAIELWNSRN